jgi:hypothetical protein
MQMLLEIALLGIAFSGYVRWPGRALKPASSRTKPPGHLLGDS